MRPQAEINASAHHRCGPEIVARHWRLGGQVQGVGFRPFVFKLATHYELTGWVRNQLGVVELFAQGDPAALDAFEHALLKKGPALACVEILSNQVVQVTDLDSFSILDSVDKGDADIHIPADLYACDDCLRELTNPSDRRYRYPFINCTQCGPRYTLMRQLPYDRVNTSMADFDLCPACMSEYTDPQNRRFHAEPVACPECGPSLEFHAGKGEVVYGNDAALAACIAALHDGRVIAIKGIGGYHLVCDATSDRAVRYLRDKKPRPDKPLAVMFPAPFDDPLGAVSAGVVLTQAEQRHLLSARRPVVLAGKKDATYLSSYIAPGLRELGVFLPYSPLHHLLLNDFGGPLVATSANVGGEPVLTDKAEVESRLAHIAEGFLHHNRPIERVADDPVYRTIAGSLRPLRSGRGNAPQEITLPYRLDVPVLAVGGHMKNTVCLAWEDRAVISPHIGELTSPRSVKLFEQTLEALQSLYQVRAEQIICDAHPAYASTRWAERSGLPVHKVFHHHAHASSTFERNAASEPWLVFTWDGTGYGDDGTLWGGEALLGTPGSWQRVASLRPFRLPGGERAAREPWRSATALCWEAGVQWSGLPSGEDMLHQAWLRHLNTPQTSAAGRLFDAAAALTGVCRTASFEGQGPMFLEAMADAETTEIELPLSKNMSGLYVSDWSVLLPMLMDEETPVRERASCFHTSMASALVRQALKIREQHAVSHIALSGGVFQNRVLTEQCIKELEDAGFEVHLPELIPLNDAGLSYGQTVEYASRKTATDDR